MKIILKCTLLLLFLSSCSEKEQTSTNPSSTFTAELETLKQYFQIPGLAVAVEQDGQMIYTNYLGQGDIQSNRAVDSTTVFPIASLTKIFSSVLCLQLEEQGILSLEDPVNKYLSNAFLSDSILIKHILSHTSQGKIGNQFYYSSRYGLLTKVLEQATGQSFAQLMTKQILEPLKLENTFLLQDAEQVASLKKPMASPYVLDPDITEGRVEYGYSSAAGLVSNTKDLLRFSRALDKDVLLKTEARKKMFAPFQKDLPYGYGIFHQEIQGVSVLWGYGQYDGYSSLLMKVPTQKISLVILANNNLMSDPTRLLYGDLTYSLFALSFLKNYVFDLSKLDLLPAPDSINFKTTKHPQFLRNLALAQALSASFLARYQTEKRDTSVALLEQVFQAYPDYLDYADLTLLHNLTFLKDIAFYKELGDFDQFDQEIETIAAKLLKENDNNPYVHAYLGTYYDRKGELEKAKHHFQSIVSAENFSRNWYTVEAENWLKQFKE